MILDLSLDPEVDVALENFDHRQKRIQSFTISTQGGSRHSSLAEATGATTPLRVHMPELASRRITMYPRQAAARPPHYFPPPPSRPLPDRARGTGASAAEEVRVRRQGYRAHQGTGPRSARVGFSGADREQ